MQSTLFASADPRGPARHFIRMGPSGGPGPAIARFSSSITRTSGPRAHDRLICDNRALPALCVRTYKRLICLTRPSRVRLAGADSAGHRPMSAPSQSRARRGRTQVGHGPASRQRDLSLARDAQLLVFRSPSSAHSLLRRAAAAAALLFG